MSNSGLRWSQRESVRTYTKRENLLRCSMSADYFSKNLCAMWDLADQIIVSCLVGWSIDQLVNQVVNSVSWLASSASANSYLDCLSSDYG
jgi:hypothetical protein